MRISDWSSDVCSSDLTCIEPAIADIGAQAVIAVTEILEAADTGIDERIGRLVGRGLQFTAHATDAHAHVWGERPITRIEEHAVELGTVLAPVFRIGNTVGVELVPRPAQFPAPIIIASLARPKQQPISIS